jgi:chemotaxis protein methyltransferase CheR
MSLTTSDFDYIRDVVRRQSAIVLEPGKEYLVESRLVPLARKEGEQSIATLVTRMRADTTGALAGRVVDAMTTNETSFFRDNHPFEAMHKHVLPQLVRARTAERRLSIWCGASSSGQEPYTLTMLLEDVLATRPGWQASLLATDISQEMLDRTRAGVYTQLEVNRGLPVARLLRHFDKVGTQWQVKPELRAMVTTRLVNLAVPFPPIGTFDVVFLRNVLIYFDAATKRAVLQRVRQVLRPDGYLFLGGAETTLGIDDAFDRVVLDRATAYRLRTSTRP